MNQEDLAYLEAWAARGLMRSRFQVLSQQGVEASIQDSLSSTVYHATTFCQNDYLGLARDPRVKAAMINSVLDVGVGSGASPMVSGYHDLHAQLERALADFLGHPRAVLFSCGYMANMGVLNALADRHTLVFADRDCHASLVDGIQLSRARFIRYRHLDLTHLEDLLKRYPGQRRLIVTERCFSMAPDETPMASLLELAQRHHAQVYVDDAHGFGVVDPLPYDPSICYVTPLGKALGIMGAVVSGSEARIERVLQCARTYRYSTALPPSVAAAGLTALKIVQNEPERRAKLHANTTYFQEQAIRKDLNIQTNQYSSGMSPIQMIALDAIHDSRALQRVLLKRGVWVGVMRPPTVKIPSIRISLSALHEPQQIDRLTDALMDVLHPCEV